MRNLLTGIAITVVVLIVLLGINVLCNMNNIHLDAVVTGTCASVSAMLIYGGLTKKKENSNNN